MSIQSYHYDPHQPITLGIPRQDPRPGGFVAGQGLHLAEDIRNTCQKIIGLSGCNGVFNGVFNGAFNGA